MCNESQVEAVLFNFASQLMPDTVEALTHQTGKKWRETQWINAVNRSDLVDQWVDVCVSRVS